MLRNARIYKCSGARARGLTSARECCKRLGSELEGKLETRLRAEVECHVARSRVALGLTARARGVGPRREED